MERRSLTPQRIHLLQSLDRKGISLGLWSLANVQGNESFRWYPDPGHPRFR